MLCCLPLRSGYSIYVDIYENIFEKCFKNAYFINTKPNITNIYRLYKYEDVFDKELEVFNYMLIKYDATNDLQDRNGYNCLSEYDRYNRNENDVIASKCFNSKHFQLAIVFGDIRVFI